RASSVADRLHDPAEFDVPCPISRFAAISSFRLRAEGFMPTGGLRDGLLDDSGREHLAGCCPVGTGLDTVRARRAPSMSSGCGPPSSAPWETTEKGLHVSYAPQRIGHRRGRSRT